MEQTLTKTEILRKLFKEYGLVFDSKDPTSKDNDLFKHQHYTIITRSGIEKIQKAANISIKYIPAYVDPTTVVLKAEGIRLGEGGKEIGRVETFSSASNQTSKSAYYAEMAEKRAMSRIVLKLAGLYEFGVYGEDESDDFKRSKLEQKGAVYKGT